jgi:hypothetical protein
MSPRSFLRAGAAMLATVSIPFAAVDARALAGATGAQSSAQLRAAQVLASVRRAVGHRHLRRFGHGLAIAERAAEGAASETVFVGTRRGELRAGEEFGFDGSYRWLRDPRRATAVPAPQRQHEKNAWPLWIRSHWWLSPESGIAAEVLAADSTVQEVALRLTLPDGLVPATVYVDRATWLPSRLIVPYEHGPYTARLSDWRPVHGVLLPFAVQSSYRGRTSGRRVLAVARVGGAAAFAPPPMPADHRFAGTAPVALEARQGAPLSSVTPGHVYVRGAVDGSFGWWHFDSGSDSMIIDESVAERLGMEVIGTHRSMGADGTPREGTWRRGRSFTLGRITIENPVFRAMDLSANNAPPGERRMGTIGYDLFARSVVEYAHGGREVRVCDPAGYRLPRGGRWRRLGHIDATPAAPGLVEGRIEGLFQVDTGSAGTIDFTTSFHERHRLLEGRETREMRSLGSGGAFAVRVGRIARFDFAGRRYDDLEVSFRTGGISREGSAGTIGRDVLAPFRTVFDYRGRRIAFLPLAAGPGRCG